MMEDAALAPWWAFGDYTGGLCPKCNRQRLMKATDDSGQERIICEKCDWEPATNAYRVDVLVCDPPA